MRIRSLYLFLLLPAFLLGACSSGLPPHIAARFAGPTLTPTPFLPGVAIASLPQERKAAVYPVNFSNNYSLENSTTAIWGDFPAPIAASNVAIPAPMDRFTQPDGQINILIMGSDQRPDDYGFRTDVLLLLTLNRSAGQVSLTSFPRDLYVYQPGWRMDRINTAQARGGFEMTALTFEYNFGIRPDHWLMVNFDGFKNIITSLGGIQVEVAQALSDERDGYDIYSVAAGTTPMDAETALWYVRSRGTSNDFDRTRRQQEVLHAIFSSSLSLDLITRAPDLYQSYKQTVTTDISIGDIISLLPLALQVNSEDIHRFSVGPDQVIPWMTTTGAQVLLPDREAINSLLGQALSSPSE